MSQTRRRFLQTSVAALAAAPLYAQSERRPKILMRSSWQTVNIGDIGHTPGVLALLEKYVPEADVVLWPSNVKNGVRELLSERFPRLSFVQSTSATSQAIKDCDFLLHGSGASLVATRQVKQWTEQTDKPYGIFGITLPTISDLVGKLLSGADFLYCRDSVSLQLAKDTGVSCPVMEFGPDGAFAVDLRNDAAAEATLQEHDLHHEKFVCCIPRYRYTPYWLIKEGRELDPVKDARNQEMKEHDHAPLRAAIEAVVTQTDHKVLLCPEDQTHVAIGKEMLLDKLPAHVKKRVVWRDTYWLTDEAISTYVRSSGLFGLEMHSPIMCVGNGVPALVGRFEEQTSKGFMWRDIGLDDWLFDMDQPDQVAQLSSTVLSLIQDPAAAKARVASAQAFVEQRQQAMVGQLRQSLGLSAL